MFASDLNPVLREVMMALLIQKEIPGEPSTVVALHKKVINLRVDEERRVKERMIH